MHHFDTWAVQILLCIVASDNPLIVLLLFEHPLIFLHAFVAASEAFPYLSCAVVALHPMSVAGIHVP